MTEQIMALSQRKASWLERLLRRQLLGALEDITGAHLAVRDPEGSWEAGDPVAALKARVVVHDPEFYRLATLGGSQGAGESYMLGHWECDDLADLMRILVRNKDTLDRMDSGLARVSAPFLRRFHAGNRNTRSGSRRNIAAHYDLGNEFFELFLDRSMMYSSAVYRTGEETLEAAQYEKLERICRKLRLGPDTHVMEIGTGWGGFAIHAARQYGARVTTTTISREQFEFATRRVREAGVADRVELLLEDYRDLAGRFDRVVSIEMIEAVGHHYLETYLAKISRLLKDDGQALIQAITIEDHRYERALKDIDFIKRFIFPGSFIPSVAAILEASARGTDLRLTHLEDFGTSYALTLREWRRRFDARLDQVRRLGYPERFVRMWQFYLSYCEGGFLERSISDAQLLFSKPRCTEPSILPMLDAPGAPGPHGAR